MNQQQPDNDVLLPAIRVGIYGIVFFGYVLPQCLSLWSWCTRSSLWRTLANVITYGSLALNNSATSYYPAEPLSGAMIRLATLQPGTGVIKIVVDNYRWEDLPAYDGLSYVWGHETDSYILVNDKLTRIGDNLYGALNRVRHDHQAQFLWIDALCVAQDNNTEKNHQLPMFSAIYSKAEQVRVWLGDADHVRPEDITALETLISAGKLTSYEWSDHEWWVHDLAVAQYWKRMWIVQELIAAKKIKVSFGAVTLSWTSLSRILATYAQLQKTYAFRQLYFTHVVKAIDESHRTREVDSGALSLDRLIERFQDSMCDDPRDKIYALLGIASDVNLLADLGPVSIAVDYKKSLAQIYGDVMAFYHKSSDEEQRIRMMAKASLLRRILSRTYRPCTQLSANRPAREVWKLINCNERRWHWRCEQSLAFIAEKEQVNLWLEVYNLMGSLVKRAVDHARPNVATYCWDHSSPELWNQWQAKNTPYFNIRGQIVDSLVVTTLEASELAADPRGRKRWLHEVLPHISAKSELRKRSVLMQAILEKSASQRWLMTKDIVQIEDSQYSRCPASSDSTSKFLAAGNSTGLLAIVPSSAETGDLMCRFYGSRGTAILRPLGKSRYCVVGRAGMLFEAKDANWDLPLNIKNFLHSNDEMPLVDIRMEFNVLNALSAQSIELEATQF